MCRTILIRLRIDYRVMLSVFITNCVDITAAAVVSDNMRGLC
jgi:hypothetical protein